MFNVYIKSEKNYATTVYLIDEDTSIYEIKNRKPPLVYWSKYNIVMISSIVSLTPSPPPSNLFSHLVKSQEIKKCRNTRIIRITDENRKHFGILN